MISTRTHWAADRGRTLMAGLVVVMAAIATFTLTSAAHADERLAGDDRFGTAAAISAAAYPDGADTAYLARAGEFADALAAGALTDGPILLVPSEGHVPTDIADELDRLDPQEVVALGGISAVSEAILEEAADGRDTSRLAGAGRFHTAAAIAAAAFPDGADQVYLARADEFADALAAGALTDGPILLVPRDGPVPEVVTAAVEDHDPQRLVALGGTAAISDAVVREAAGGRTTDRLAGQGRFATAAAIARAAFPDGAARAYLARADEFADALAAGSLQDGPVLLVPSEGDLPQPVADALAQLGVFSVRALGGTAAVSDDMVAQAAAVEPEGVAFLDGLEPEDSAGHWGDGEVAMDGQVYQRTVAVSGDHDQNLPGTVGTRDYDLARDYEAFRATLGVDDESPERDSEWRVVVEADGEEVFRESFGLGETVDLDVDVSGVLRLHVEVEQLQGDDLDWMGFGNARLLADAADDVDTDAVTAETDSPSQAYLDDVDPVRSAGHWEAREVAMDGQVYQRTVAVSGDHDQNLPGTVGTRDYDLARDYEAFRATLGVDDESPERDSEWRVVVEADGEEVFRESFGLGETVDLDVDVSGVLRLHVEVEQLQGDDLDWMGFGDAELIGAG